MFCLPPGEPFYVAVTECCCSPCYRVCMRYMLMLVVLLLTACSQRNPAELPERPPLDPPVETSPDPHALYRLGRTWTLRTTTQRWDVIDHNRRALRYGYVERMDFATHEVIEVGEDHAIVNIVRDQEGARFGTEPRLKLATRIEFSGAENADGPIMEIQTPAGNFECRVELEGKTASWISTQYPGLLVLQLSGNHRTELVEITP